MAPLSLLDHYTDKVTAGHIEANTCQEEVLHRLEELRVALTGGFRGDDKRFRLAHRLWTQRAAASRPLHLG
jgi:hypothetical protein